MQLITILTTLAASKVAKSVNGLVTRDGLLGSKLCTDVNFTGTCETITNVANGLKPNQCILLDSDLATKGVSSIQPLERSWCTYYLSDNCQDLTSDNCGHYDATSPIGDLTTVSPTNSNHQCGGNMDKKIASFMCRPFQEVSQRDPLAWETRACIK